MEVIIDAKERQAAEANKNATSLLLEIDQEKVSTQWLLCSLHFFLWWIWALAVLHVNDFSVSLQKHEEDRKAAAARKRAKKKRQKEKKQALKLVCYLLL